MKKERELLIAVVNRTGRLKVIKVIGYKKVSKKERECLLAAGAQVAPLGAVARCFLAVGLASGAGAQRSPLSWAMGSSQRLAAVAAVSHAKHYYNHTQPTSTQNDPNPFSLNIFFVRLVEYFYLLV